MEQILLLPHHQPQDLLQVRVGKMMMMMMFVLVLA